LGLTCLTVAIPMQLKQNWITVGWSVEAAVLTWVGFHLDSSKTRRAAVLIVAMVICRLLFLDSSFSGAFADDFTFLFNKRGMAFAVAVLSLFAMAFLYHRNREKLADIERWLTGGLFIGANLLVLFFLTTEARYSQPNATVHLRLVGFLLYCAGDRGHPSQTATPSTAGNSTFRRHHSEGLFR
jgi:hypothetical protein